MYFDPQFIFLIKFFMTSTNLETLHPSRSLFLGSLIRPACRSREDLRSGFPGVQIYVRLSLLTSRSQPHSSPLTLKKKIYPKYYNPVCHLYIPSTNSYEAFPIYEILC